MTIYLQLDGIKGERTDAEGNILRLKSPEITRGMEAHLELKLRDISGSPLEKLERFATWEFYAGNDWDLTPLPYINHKKKVYHSNELIDLFMLWGGTYHIQTSAWS